MRAVTVCVVFVYVRENKNRNRNRKGGLLHRDNKVVLRIKDLVSYCDFTT